MIEKLLVKFYQCHDFKVVKFSRVTTLVGPSKAGKTAIMRALRWVMTNSITGTSFVGRWGKAPYAFAKLWIDKHTISRKRSNSVNLYRLDGHDLKAPGMKVPQQIADLVNIGEANLQSQIEPPFWFTESAGEVSRRLNSIINLGSIDRALEKAASEVRRSKARLEISSERLEQHRLRKRQTIFAVRLDSQVQVLEQLTTSIEKTVEGRGLIESAMAAVQSCEKRRRTLGAAIQLAGPAASAQSKLDRVSGELAEIRAGIAQLEQYGRLASTKPPDPARLLMLSERLDERSDQCRQIDSLIFGIENQTWIVRDLKRKITETESEVTRRFGKRCKYCGQRLQTSYA